MAAGFLVYFLYGRTHSRLGKERETAVDDVLKPPPNGETP
jgi:APA family basic amino acid/polyamine antiporter